MKADVFGQSQPDGTRGRPPSPGERCKVLKRASKSYRTPCRRQHSAQTWATKVLFGELSQRAQVPRSQMPAA